MERYSDERRRGMLRTLALGFVVLVMGLLLAQTASASNLNTAVINRDSVTFDDEITNGSGEPISLEQFAAENAGFKVTVVTGSEWEAMTAAQFAQYQVLIVGDPDCSSTPPSATANADTWTSVVMGTAGLGTSVGNRTVVGTDPEDHYLFGEGGAAPRIPGDPTSAGAEHLVQDGIAFAGAVPGATGVYFDTSCNDTGEKDVAAFNKLTAGTGEFVESPTHPACESPVVQIATNPVFNTGPTKLTNEDISGWECSSHESYTSYPSDWTALAITIPLPEEVRPTPVCGNDIETGAERCGQAYVLVAGQGIVAKAPNLSLEPEHGTDVAGGDHTVVANVHKDGKPLVGIPVGFIVTELNNGVGGTCTTTSGAPNPECKSDELGNVYFTYHDVNGVGKDTIIGSVTIETEFEENETIKKVLTTERATATQEWITPPPPAAAAPAKAAVLAFGSAHIASRRACVASTGYVASVSGKAIKTVTYSLDGHKLKTLKKANSHGSYTLRIKVKSGKSHHLSIRVTFTSASNTKPVTLKRTLARCAARRVVKPRFTG